jgi:hypothetical protein
MALTIGIDGIGGDKTKEGLPYHRAIEGIHIAELDDVCYELAVPPNTLLNGLPKNVTRVAATSVKDVVTHFSQRKVPLVTAFDTQQGMPLFLNCRIHGVRRIPLAAEYPREDGGIALLLDCGSNTDMRSPGRFSIPDPHDVARVKEFFDWYEHMHDRNSEDMVNFARLGSLYMTLLHNIASPRVGLLNVGKEPYKGDRFVKDCDSFLHKESKAHFSYQGFSEPKDREKLDVLVTDGFVGNTNIKTIEHTVSRLKRSLSSKWYGKIISYVIGKREVYNPCAFLLGLRDLILVKVHGEAKPEDFAVACRQAKTYAQPISFGEQTYDNMSTAISTEYLRRYC